MTNIHLINIYTSDEAPQTTNEATHTEHKILIFRNKTAPGFQRFYALFITYVISALNNMQKRTVFRIICIFLPSAYTETAARNQVYFNTKRRSRFPQAHNSGTLKDYCIYIVFRITDYQTRQRIMKQNRKRDYICPQCSVIRVEGGSLLAGSVRFDGTTESGADNSPKETEWDNQTVGGDGYGIGDDNWDNF